MGLNRSSGSLRTAAELIKLSNFAIAFTGAGSSTPSGIPDFRSLGSGLWTHYQPMEVASLTAFRQNPEKFYNWLRPFVDQILTAEPNPAHFALAQLEKSEYLHTIITQNFDGLHQRAGSVNVLQVHGTLNKLTCIGCYKQVDVGEYTDPFIVKGKIPLCNTCGIVLKPDIVLFEEQLPATTWIRARQMTLASDLIIVAGTSLVVYPAAKLPVLAMKNGARIIIVNKSPTYMDEFADVVIHGDVAEILPEITSRILDE